jgi:hypothetical protein
LTEVSAAMPVPADGEVIPGLATWHGADGTWCSKGNAGTNITQNWDWNGAQSIVPHYQINKRTGLPRQSRPLWNTPCRIDAGMHRASGESSSHQFYPLRGAS